MKAYLLFILITISTWGQAQPLRYRENYQTPISIAEQPFMAEIVSTPKAMQLGMMYRPDIAEHQAMLFVYPKPQAMAFWMKNMQIPLDILFFNQAGSLQEIKANVPPCQTQSCPIYPAKQDDNQFVVEIRAGQAEKLGLQVGDKLGGF